ncbi:MAG TPA: LamG domain-containing protein, partial [Spirochaetales bacterium]|nr:LamG domain-containing protein [Spirochaetales bacterium]
SIEVTPGSGSYRSGVIAVSGVAEDAYGLASASVSVLDKATGQVLRTYPATVSGSTWTTGAVVDTTQFPDGQYTVAVTLKDARGNSSEDRVLIGFDNSAPTVLVEEPLDLDAEYNGYITLAGQAHDSMSSIVSVTVGVYRASDSSLVDEFLSATVPKWAVQFNAADPAYSLTLADLVLVVQATDEGGNSNTWQYEYKPLATANAGSPVTASLVNQLESQAQDTDTVDGLTFNKATLLSYRSFLDPAVPADASILKVNVDSDKPTFTFVTPGEASISEATAERYAGGTKANGTISDDDNNETMLAWYRYVPSTGNIEDGAWTPATVEGSGYDQRWSFNLPGTNGIYKIQVRAQDKIVAGSPTADSVFGESAVRYVIVDDGRPLVSIDTNNPVPWNLYYGSGQSILVSGSASRTVSAWIMTDASGAIISWGSNSVSKAWQFRITGANEASPAGSLRVDVNGGYIAGTTDLRDGQWHHVAVVFDSSIGTDITDAQLYIDGVLEGAGSSQARTVNTDLNGTDVRIGTDQNGRRFNG